MIAASYSVGFGGATVNVDPVAYRAALAMPADEAVGLLMARGRLQKAITPEGGEMQRQGEGEWTEKLPNGGYRTRRVMSWDSLWRE